MVWLTGSGLARVGLAKVMTGAMALGLAAGCSDDGSGGYYDGTTSDPDPEPEVDYSGCAPVLQDPLCMGRACGRTPEAADYLGIVIEEVDNAGYGGRFVATRAEYTPLTNVLRVDYQLRRSWFRVAYVLEMEVPDSEALLRLELQSRISAWSVPTSVADPEEISDAIESCHLLLSYDHCVDNHAGFIVENRYDWSQPGCVYKSTYVTIDARDASTIECVVEEEYPCD